MFLIANLVVNELNDSLLVVVLIDLLNYLLPHGFLNYSCAFTLYNVLNGILVEVALAGEHFFEQDFQDQINCFTDLVLNSEELFVAFITKYFYEENYSMVFVQLLMHAVEQGNNPLYCLDLVSTYFFSKKDVQVALH